jgi:ribosomal protein S18 acetylase RimI-like enzyme
MDAREGVGETLVAAIEDIRARAAGDTDALVRLNDLLVESGYLDQHRSLYERLGFTYREERMYLVREGFPRIVERDLPDGVARVRYEVAVDACETFRVPVADTVKVIAKQGLT